MTASPQARTDEPGAFDAKPPPCDVCRVVSQVLVSRKRADGTVGYLAMCMHHYGTNAVLFELGGWKIVRDRRPALHAEERNRGAR